MNLLIGHESTKVIDSLYLRNTNEDVDYTTVKNFNSDIKIWF